MIGEYICPFYHNSGEICGRTCMRSEGCSYHWKAKKKYLVLIVESQLVQLLVVAHYILGVLCSAVL